MKTNRHSRRSIRSIAQSANRATGRAMESLETRRLYAVAEPNGSFDIASTDSNNVYMENNYTNSDSVASYDPDDYYKFNTLYGKSHLYAVINGLSSDADLYVYNSNQQVIAQSRLSGNNSETVNVDLPANQDFYIRVAKYGGGATSYNLLAYNDYSGSTLSTARDIGVVWGQTNDKAEGTTQLVYNDYLDYRDNVDLMKFKMEAPGTISLRKRHGANPLECNVQLLDQNGSVLRTLSGNDLDGFNLDRYTVKPGTYYVKISQTSGASDYSMRITGDYAGDTAATARDMGDITGTSRKRDDMVGLGFDGLATYADSMDMYKFKLSKTSDVDFKVSVDTAAFPTNLFGTTSYLARDTDGDGFIDPGEKITSFSQNSKSTVNLAAGTYFVVVEPTANYTTYSLDMDSDADSVAGDPQGYNNLSKATNAGTLSGESSFTNGFGISNGDITDFYKFTMATAGHLDAAASVNPFYSRDDGKPDMVVIKDLNNNGRYDGGEQVTPFATGKISEDLAAGTYFLVLTGTGSQAAYDVRFVSDNAGDSLSKARAFAAPSSTTQTIKDYVEQNFGADSDPNDYFSFTLGAANTISLNTTGVEGEDIAMQLIQDKNSNGKVDSGEILAASDKLNSPTEAISKSLSAGKYFVRVFGVNGGTNYAINLKTGAATPASDPDDTIGEVKNVTKNTKKIGEFADFTLESKTDVDLIKFVAKAGDKVGFQTESRGGSNLNTYLRLFDSTGTAITSNNDGSFLNGNPGTKFSFINYNFTKAGTYYIGVSLNPNKSYNINTGSGDVAGTTTGAYRFRVMNVAPQIVASSIFSGTPVSDDSGSDAIV